MRASLRAWLLPLAAALTVLVGVLGVNAVMTGGDGAGIGPDRDRRAVEDPPVPLPTREREAADLPRGMVRMLGYESAGRQVTVTYRVFDLSCTQLAVEPTVSESADSVVLTLRRAPSEEQQLVNCPSEPYLDRVYVDLSSQLRGRAVVDGISGRRVPTLETRS